MLQFRFFPWAGIGLSASRATSKSGIVGIMSNYVGIATLRGEEDKLPREVYFRYLEDGEEGITQWRLREENVSYSLSDSYSVRFL